MAAPPPPQGVGGSPFGWPGTGAPGLTPYRMPANERTMLQYTTDYFDHYWNGLASLKRFLDEVASGTRAPIYSAMVVPRQRTQPRPADGRPTGPAVDVTMGRGTFGASKPPNAAAQLDQFMHHINQGQYDMIHYTRPLRLELKKVLGKGGYGIACLFEFSELDGTRRNIVLKASSRANDISLEVANANVSPKALNLRSSF